MRASFLHYGSIQKIAILYIIIWSISPPLEIDMIYRLIALACAGIWGIFAITRGLPYERQHLYALFFLLMVCLIGFIETSSLKGVLRQIAIIILVLCFIINYFYQGRWEELKGIIPIVLIVFIFFNLKTAAVLIEDPTIARKLVRADESIYPYLRQGVGGYNLIYPQVCIFPAILAWIIKAFRNNKTCFLIGCVWLISYVLCILNAGYSIAIFATILGMFMLWFYKGENVLGAFLMAIVIFLIGLGSILYVDGIRNSLLQIFDGTAVAKKINDLVASAEAGAAEGSIYVRINAYRSSLKAIFNYPIIGGLWFGSGGGHSALLDAFAKYGVWGGYIYAKMLFHVPNYYNRNIIYHQVKIFK